MSAKQAVTIVCRALSVYFLVWFLDALTISPSNIFSLFHYASTPATSGVTYLRNSNIIDLGFRLVRMVILFFAIQWFYRAGPKLHAYFLAPSEGDEHAPAS